MLAGEQVSQISEAPVSEADHMHEVEDEQIQNDHIYSSIANCRDGTAGVLIRTFLSTF